MAFDRRSTDHGKKTGEARAGVEIAEGAAD
jgi:hypothetical protein